MYVGDPPRDHVADFCTDRPRTGVWPCAMAFGQQRDLDSHHTRSHWRVLAVPHTTGIPGFLPVMRQTLGFCGWESARWGGGARLHVCIKASAQRARENT